MVDDTEIQEVVLSVAISVVEVVIPTDDGAGVGEACVGSAVGADVRGTVVVDVVGDDCGAFVGARVGVVDVGIGVAVEGTGVTVGGAGVGVAGTDVGGELSTTSGITIDAIDKNRSFPNKSEMLVDTALCTRSRFVAKSCSPTSIPVT